MPQWLNYVYIIGPANGTSSHTIDPASSTGAVAGTPFSPTTGRLLVVIAEGPVTSSTPSGWTLPTSGSAVQNSALYVWHKTAAGADTLTTNHNASNYRVGFAVFEFAAGSTFAGSASSVGQASSASNPALTGLTDSNQVFGAAGWVDNIEGGTTGSATWDGSNVELIDRNTDRDSGTGNAGFWLGVCYQEDYSSASYTPTPTITAPASGDSERLTFAVSTPSAPVFTDDPEVTGTTTVGEILTCGDGSYTGNPEPTFSYQWQRDNEGGGAYSDISSETSSTLVLTDSDLFCNIRCVVTLTNTVGSDTATTAAVGPVAAAPLQFSIRLSGGASNSVPASSLGGVESSILANGNTIFGSIGAEQADAGITDYRGIYVHNDDDEDATVVLYFIDDDDDYPGRTYFAVGPAVQAAGATMATIANASSAPAGVSFNTGTSAGAGLDLGTIPAGDGKGVWIRRAVPSSTPSGVTDNQARIRLELTPA